MLLNCLINLEPGNCHQTGCNTNQAIRYSRFFKLEQLQAEGNIHDKNQEKDRTSDNPSCRFVR